MPRCVISPQAPSPKHERFVKKLVQEFTASSANLQPLILDEQVPSTGSRHVRFIWDAWKDLTDEQRSAVIVDAYTEAAGPEAAGAITVAWAAPPAMQPLRGRAWRDALSPQGALLRPWAAISNPFGVDKPYCRAQPHGVRRPQRRAKPLNWKPP